MKFPSELTPPTEIDAIIQAFSRVHDFIHKTIETNVGKLEIYYLFTLVDQAVIDRKVMEPLLRNAKTRLQSGEAFTIANAKLAIESITQGNLIVYVHEQAALFKFITYSAPQRAVAPSEIEVTVIGPQDAFVESIQTNVSLIKRRIHSQQLKTTSSVIGTESQTEVCTMYIDHLVNNENVAILEERFRKLSYPSFQDTSMLKQLIEDNPFSPFPQLMMTTRPDAVAKYLVDGRIAIVMDNSPNVLICPSSFFDLFTSNEDYYNRWTSATLLRGVRFFGFFMSILLTPMYIAVLSFHQGVLPFEVLMTLQESRSHVPFPPIIEVLFMELTIEVLREAGTRMPTKIGQTIGIVGGIVIGTAAVEAGRVSNILIVFVALSTLLSFLQPNYLMNSTSRVIRYVFIIAAGLFGFLGMMFGVIWLMNHLLNLTSLGKPYFTIGTIKNIKDVYDKIIRAPLKYIQTRRRISMSPKPSYQTKKRGHENGY